MTEILDNAALNRLRQALDSNIVENYDCVVGNIAKFVLLQGCDPDLIAGSPLSFEPSVASNGCWTLDRTNARQIDAIATLPGVTIGVKEGLHLPPSRYASVIIGDGREMPWTPYFNNESLEHGFLCLPVDGGFVGYDAYNTVTQYGPARPQVIPTDQWMKISPWRSILVSEVKADVQSHITMPEVFQSSEEHTEKYLEAVHQNTQSLEQLATDTWVMARARAVNLAFTRKTGKVNLEKFCTTSQRAWAKASEAVYVALQRKNRGKPYPEVFKEAIEAAVKGEAALFAAWRPQQGFS